MRHDGWGQLLNGEEHGGCLIPHDAALPRARRRPRDGPPPISPEKREDIIAHMAAGPLGAAGDTYREI
jgi:hypothetical protein